MQTHRQFIFDSYQLDATARTVTLRYSFDDTLNFAETLALPADLPLQNADSPDVKNALFALHLAGGASYYKAFCPPEIVVRSGHLDAEQADFWNEFYTKGLGEFFFQNKIDFRGLINFPVSDKASRPVMGENLPTPKKALVPFGGGKDSQVTVELLKKNNIDITLFRMQGHAFITELAELNDLPLLQVGRKLDPQLFELNKQGALNGHVPITGYVIFLTLATAMLYGYDSIFFSNERSSDFGNIAYLGMEVNHQWSKSNEAELMIRRYIERWITQNTRYLNVLRPLSELHIAEMFTKYPRYFAHITSCNRNWLWQKLDETPNQSRWCGECDKCTFVFALFAAFLPMERVVKIFGKNLFEDQNLLSSYRQLWGAEAFKPFQCVGTPEETQAAMYLATRSDDYAKTFIGQEFITNVLPDIDNPDQLVKDAMSTDFSDVPPYIMELVKKEIAS